MTYKDIVNDFAIKIPKSIIDIKSIRRKGRAPTQAFSDFISHNEQGFWAEDLFYSGLINTNLPLVPVRYGKADKIIAGDPEFKEFYNQYQDELDSIGKRPDIIIFDKNKYKSEWGKDISGLKKEELDSIVPLSIAAFEVRSSAYLTKKFISKKGRSSLSFTPKVEDILVILKWINTYGVPHFYVQVFFDRIYILPFVKILGLLVSMEESINNFIIERNPKNQFKDTIHIPLSNGLLLSDVVIQPEVIGVRKELASGRLLHHVSFVGGSAALDKNLLLDLIKKPY